MGNYPMHTGNIGQSKILNYLTFITITTMAVKQTKTLADVTAVNSMSASQYIPLSDGSGNVTKITLANLKASILAGLDLNAIEDGVFIMYTLKSNNYAYMVKPHNWPSVQTSGEKAAGVVVVEGGKILVVAPTETTLYWSSEAVSGGGVTTSDRLTALADWAGKTNTAAQAAKAACSSSSYAAGYCHAYSNANDNGQGLTAGKWWLPSLGEMMMIYANMKKINYALSLITGATQLAETWYWTSTEYSATHAWRLYLDDGGAYYYTK